MDSILKIPANWEELCLECEKLYFKELSSYVYEEYRTHTIYPPMEDIFNALKYVSPGEVKVVILGQDPYHEEGQAHGLAFSVPGGVKIPPSLRNIFKEMEEDVGGAGGGSKAGSGSGGEAGAFSLSNSNEISGDGMSNVSGNGAESGLQGNFGIGPRGGDLSYLALQGVLLLNTVLTVRAGEANSHKNKGWEIFTDRILSILNENNSPKVFMLWGAPAAKKIPLITNPNHLILTAPHPSPLSAYRGFFGCRHFSKANEFLASQGLEPIQWVNSP